MSPATQILFPLYLIMYISVGDGKEPSKVIGGERAYIIDFPHQVSIHVDGYHNCGGTLVSEHHVLTAAHCALSDSPLRFLDVVIHSGSDDMEDETVEDRRNHFVFTIVVHEAYVKDIDMDLAIMSLMQPIRPAIFIRPIALEEDRKLPLPGHVVVLASWGSMNFDQWESPRFLQRIKMTVMTIEACETRGDSGSGALYNGRVVGIASTVVGSTRVQTFVRVSSLGGWIRATLQRY